MMKKTVCIIFSLLFVCSLCSCGSEKTQPASAGSGAEYQTVPLSDGSDVDLDLTALSSTMIYSEVYNIMSTPGDYIGKTIKMNGVFATDDNENYYFCIIKDATACCQQGIEFILNGAQYPDGYPSLGSDITVLGTFEQYYEGDQPYYHLIDATLC
ncbi:MAG: hypothetical protein IJK60_01430 [Clostridia bacterium]|nr:hypothetical protein [Clostridia bacterium]